MSATHKTGLRADAAWRLRQLSSFIWRKAKLGEVRYLSAHDLALIQLVGRIDGVANRIDGSYR